MYLAHPYFFFVPYYIPQQIASPIQNIKCEEQSNQLHHSNSPLIEETMQSKPSGITRGKGQLWSAAEIENLVTQYKKYDGNWSAIVKHLKGRNISQCSQKYRKLDDQVKRTKQKWTPVEDEVLLDCYAQFGKQWVTIANKLPGRSSKQVRDRFVNQLNPKLNRTPWTEEEDLLILREYEKQGAKWAHINKYLDNRSENQVKNRFYYCIQKKYRGELHSYLKIQE